MYKKVIKFLDKHNILVLQTRLFAEPACLVQESFRNWIQA